jgi:hypothetical protein
VHSTLNSFHPLERRGHSETGRFPAINFGRRQSHRWWEPTYKSDSNVIATDWDRIGEYLAMAGLPERTTPIAAERAVAREEALDHHRRIELIEQEQKGRPLERPYYAKSNRTISWQLASLLRPASPQASWSLVSSLPVLRQA